MRMLLAVLCLGVASLSSPPLSAQEFPAKPLRMIVGYSPGGATDVLGRLTAQHLGQRLNQNIVVENRPGATGIIGLETVMWDPLESTCRHASLSIL